MFIYSNGIKRCFSTRSPEILMQVSRTCIEFANLNITFFPILVFTVITAREIIVFVLNFYADCMKFYLEINYTPPV